MTSVHSILEAAEALSPVLQESGARIEAARRLPPDILEALRDAGCFRILHPTSHGGVGGDLEAAMTLYRTLARADASTAWTVMIGSASWIDLVGLPRASFDALFGSGHDTITAGTFNPSGTIMRDGDAYRVTGRWSFASGCQHATWIYANCIEHDGDGPPQFRIAVLGPDEVVIEDTWHVAGLRGTGSHHFRVEDVAVPAERTLRPFDDPPSIDGPVTRLPIPAVISLFVASVAVGIGRGALDDVLALAPVRTPLLATGPLARDPTFHDAIARADTELRAASLLLDNAAVTAWATAAERPAALDERGALRAAAAWVVERATAAVDIAHRAAGSGAIYADQPLQRRLRDIQTLRQHFLVRPDTFVTAGAIITGGAPEVPIF